MPITFEIHTDLRPWTTNAERKHAHWAKRAALVSTWRTYFAYAAKRYPALEWAEFEVEPFQKGGRLQDTGACHPAVKAAIDGLVDAGILEDDSPAYVRAITFLPPQRGKDGLTLRVAGETKSDHMMGTTGQPR